MRRGTYYDLREGTARLEGRLTDIYTDAILTSNSFHAGSQERPYTLRVMSGDIDFQVARRLRRRRHVQKLRPRDGVEVKLRTECYGGRLREMFRFDAFPASNVPCATLSSTTATAASLGTARLFVAFHLH